MSQKHEVLEEGTSPRDGDVLFLKLGATLLWELLWRQSQNLVRLDEVREFWEKRMPEKIWY